MDLAKDDEACQEDVSRDAGLCELREQLNLTKALLANAEAEHLRKQVEQDETISSLGSELSSSVARLDKMASVLDATCKVKGRKKGR